MTAFDLTGLHPPASRGRGLRARHPHSPWELSAVKSTPATPSRPGPSPSRPTETEPAPGVLPPGQPWGGREQGWESGPLLVRPTCFDSPLLYGSPRRGSPFGRRWESRRACTAPAPRTARKREESRAFHGYNKSKGEVGAGEIRNFPTLGIGTCQAAAPGTPRLSLLLPASLAGGGGPDRVSFPLGRGTPPARRSPGNPEGPGSLSTGPQFPPNGPGKIQQGCSSEEARA